MFTRISPDSVDSVTVQFDGRPLRVTKGLTVAAALLEAGITHFRNTPETGSPRAPFCMMGVCFDCLMVIDGMPNSQACLIQVTEGMTIARLSQTSEALG